MKTENIVQARENPDVQNKPFAGLYRTYSEFDATEVKRLAHLLTQSQKIRQVDFKSLFCTIEKQSILSIFHREQKLL